MGNWQKSSINNIMLKARASVLKNTTRKLQFNRFMRNNYFQGKTLAKFSFTVVVCLTSLVFMQACITGEKAEVSSLNPAKSTKWYEQPMRIAALQCNLEDDNLAVIDKWVDWGFNVEQLFHPMADYYSAMYDSEKHMKILTDYVEKAHKNNLKIILYLNVHILGPSVGHNKEIWSQKETNDSIIYLYTTYPSICLNSNWKEYFFTVLHSLKTIDIDGIFLDGPVVTQNGCYCEHCKKKYKEMYHEELTPDSKHLWEFKTKTRGDFLHEAYDYWKKENPDKIFYYNFPIEHTKKLFVNLKEELNYNDILGTEGGFMFYGPSKNAFLWRPSFTSKLLESVAPEKSRVIFMAADHKPWSWWPHSPLETKLCIASVTANDANIWYGLHGSTKLLNTASGDAAKEVLNFYKENEELLAHTKSAAEVGLFYSFGNVTSEESDFAASGKAEGTREDAINALRGYYSMLTESQIPFDLVSDFGITSEKVKKYKVIIIPNVLAFDENAESVIREFVGNGGLIIAELGASLYNFKGEKNSNFALSDVFGISTSGQYKRHRNYNYFFIDPESEISRGTRTSLFPLPLLSIDIHPNSDTEILGKALEDFPGVYVPLTNPKDTLITRHRFGNGEAIYFAGGMGQMYTDYHVREYKMFVNNIISDHIKDRIKFEDAPTHLEVVLREQEGRMILHLVNYQVGPTRPFEKLTPVYDLKIKIPESWKIKNIYSRGLNTKLKSKRSDGKREYILPKLNEYDILTLEKD